MNVLSTIVSGDSISVDIATVFHGARFLKYNVSLLGYGFYGDCILDSEANRWMGPKRYDWEGTVLSCCIYFFIHCVQKKNTHSRFLSYLRGKCLDLFKIFRVCLRGINYSADIKIKYSLLQVT